MNKRYLALNRLLFTLALGVFSTPLLAQSQADGNAWDHTLAVYLWGASIEGSTQYGPDLSVDFQTILDHLEFAAMGSYQGRKGKWAVLADVIYMDVSGDKSINLVPPAGPGTGVNLDASLDMKAWVVNAAGGYNLYDDGEGTTTDFVFGLRYLDLASDLALRLSAGSPDLGISPGPVSKSGDALDAIVGARGVISLGDRWFLPWGANVGAGDSDLTWQAMAGIGFRASSWADIALTYRYLKWELDQDIVDDLALSGPLLGVAFRF